jgi:hypothetical protein
MENALYLFAGGAPAVRPFDAKMPLPSECYLARATRLNLLLIHGNRSVQDILELFLTGRHELVACWRPGQRLVLPPVARLSTLILHDVASMPFDDQRRLADWLERAAGRTQVVATTRTPLLPRVDAETFHHTLYYRLNTVVVDFVGRFPLPVTEPAAQAQ